MEIVNVPTTREGRVFKDMLMASFIPLKNFVEYNKLQNELTPDDIHMLSHAIGEGLENWVTYLKKVDEARMERGGGH